MIGSQIYPHRALLKDLPAYCRTMAAMGVTTLELCSPIGYGADFASLADGNEVRRILADHGMTSESAHFGLNELREQQPASIAWAESVGITQMLAASLGAGNGGSTPNLEQVKKAADEYNRIAEVAAKAGMQQGLHNEGFERAMVEGRRAHRAITVATSPRQWTTAGSTRENSSAMALLPATISRSVPANRGDL